MLRQKLQDKKGASMAAALLFFFACTMVTASVFSATMASMGRVQSSLQESESYFARTSALQTVVDSLLGIEYQGSYSFVQTIKNETITAETPYGSAEAPGTTSATRTTTSNSFTLLPGRMNIIPSSAGTSPAPGPSGLAPETLLGNALVSDLDYIFGSNLSPDISAWNTGESQYYSSDTWNRYELVGADTFGQGFLAPSPQGHLFDIEAAGTAPGADGTATIEKVQIQITFPEASQGGYAILISARSYINGAVDAKSKPLEALLIPADNQRELSLDTSTGPNPVSTAAQANKTLSGTYTSTPLRWKTAYIGH